MRAYVYGHMEGVQEREEGGGRGGGRENTLQNYGYVYIDACVVVEL